MQLLDKRRQGGRRPSTGGRRWLVAAGGGPPGLQLRDDLAVLCQLRVHALLLLMAPAPAILLGQPRQQLLLCGHIRPQGLKRDLAAVAILRGLGCNRRGRRGCGGASPQVDRRGACAGPSGSRPGGRRGTPLLLQQRAHVGTQRLLHQRLGPGLLVHELGQEQLLLGQLSLQRQQPLGRCSLLPKRLLLVQLPPLCAQRLAQLRRLGLHRPGVLQGLGLGGAASR